MGQKITSGDLVKQLGGELIGDSNVLINAAASLESADQHSISFFNNLKYLELLKKTNAGVVILNRESLIYHSANAIVVDNPHLYFAKISRLLNPNKQIKKEIHQSAIIHPSCRLGENIYIGPNVVIDENVVLDDGVIVNHHSRHSSKSNVAGFLSIYISD